MKEKIIVITISCLLTTLSAQMVWTQATGAAAWSARELQTTVVFDSAMWVIYGRDVTGTAKNVWRSTDGVNWILKSNQSGYRNDHASVVFDNKMWVLGGYDNGNYKNDVWCSSDGVNWSQISTNSPIWSPRIGHASVVFDNKIWILGGYSYPGYLKMNDVWYSTDGINWTLATPAAGWSPRFWHRALVYDNKIWVLGGWDGTDKNDVWYSTDGINWTQATSAANWCERHLFSVVVFDNKMLVLGGYGSSQGHLNDVWYSTNGVDWIQIPTSVPMWERRQAHTAVVFDNKIWVMGGQRAHNDFLNDVWYSRGFTEIEENPIKTSASPIKIRITPNPVLTGFAILDFSLPDYKPMSLAAFDGAGRLIFSQPLISNFGKIRLNLQQVPDGMYLVQVKGKGFSYGQKLIVRQIRK